MSPAAQGRSLSALFAVKDDPTTPAATAPILQWIRVVWRSKLCLPDETQAQDLHDAWAESEDYRQSLVDDYGARKWGVTRGPVEAMELSMHRLG